MGGLARKSTIVNNSRDAGFETLVLDAGNLFFKQDNIDPGISLDVAKINAEIIVDSFNQIGCDGFSPGSKDFSAGLNFLKSMEKKSSFDFLSCNIKDKKNKLLFKNYKTINVDGFNVGLIGATSIFDLEGIVVSDPFSSILNVVEKIKNECDYIVLLFSASDADYRRISAAGLGVDLIIRGNTKRKSTNGGSALIPVYSVGDRGKVIYQFDIKYSNLESPFLDVALYENSINSTNRKIERLKNQEDSSADLITQYENSIKNDKYIIDNSDNVLQYKSISLSKVIQDDSMVLKIIDKGKAKIEEIAGPQLPSSHHHHHHHGHDH